ncbi:MAG: ABC transporter permease [Thermodesulfobacteriota bacterium]|nr:ABC transporter permease [Thermodesulfobacteriota bacterium]
MTDLGQKGDGNELQAAVNFSRSAEMLLIHLSGTWKIEHDLPTALAVQEEIASGRPLKHITFDTSKLTGWDSGLLTFLIKANEDCSKNKIHMDKAGLPQGVQRLLALALSVPERKGTRKESVQAPFLVRVGTSAIDFGQSAVEILDFIGDAFLACIRMFRGKSRFRSSEVLLIMQETGARALPIVSLISLLVGLILAFVGAVQLVMFGAQIYVASLVGIAMVRVMGAVMTGIIMAGRTGASFAAQLGTMQVNEEIDALKTMGISPMDFLVLPRMLALVLMMPLLCLYADLMGILGGLIVGVGMLDLDVVQYYHQTKASVSLNDLWIGLFHSAVFGVLIALAGCLRGMQCHGSASAVGEATTSAVVTAIISIIVATAIITIVCNVIGI